MLGSNVPLRGGLSDIFLYGDEWGCDCIQVYLFPSREWSVENPGLQQVRQFKRHWRNSSVKVVVGHLPFLVNLASSNPETRQKSIVRLVAEMKLADILGIRYLVLHPGFFIGPSMAEGLDRLISGLDRVLDTVGPSKVMILIETMAGQGTTIGSRFEEIAYVLKNVSHRKSIGVCLDTAHLFIAGYDTRTQRGYDFTFQLFDDLIGLDRIKVIHLNDPKTKFRSRHDRHANIGEGRLGISFFRRMLADRRFRPVPKILEIPDRDEKSAETLRLLRRLEKRRRSPFPTKKSNISVVPHQRDLIVIREHALRR